MRSTDAWMALLEGKPPIAQARLILALLDQTDDSDRRSAELAAAIQVLQLLALRAATKAMRDVIQESISPPPH